MNKVKSGSTWQIARSIALVMALLALVCTSLPFVGSAQSKRNESAKLTETQRIVHVLNRLGFGARPGDVERVKAMGLESYINAQLNPEKIADPVAEAKVKNLSTLTMTTAQLYEKFPNPGMLIRQLERRGQVPSELAEARGNRTNNPNRGQMEAMPNNGSMDNPQAPSAPQNPNLPNQNPEQNEEYRRLLRQYYQENGLELPQRIMTELQASRILRAVYSERQLNEVMVDFWTNHFNVFSGKGADRWLLTSYDRDTIRPNAMGKFSELLLATAQSPAMLFYLDNFQSVSPNAQTARRRDDGPLRNLLGRRRGMRGNDPLMQDRQRPQPDNQQQRARRGINENYARELMELHTLGVDGGYTQKDVQEVARCFTGWTIFAPRGGGAAAAAMFGNGARENVGKFFFNARMHDDGEKVVLGHKIPAGGGMKDALTVLDILARHPSTARFISQKLVRYFVADNPPPALVERVAATFTKTNGDIRQTLQSIFFSPEFNSAEAYRAKVKRPFELTISALRTLGAETNGGPQLHRWIARMGEPLYGYQTPNGYSDTAESWVNTGGLLERLNFALSLASNRIPGTRVDLKRFLAADGTRDNREVMDRFLDLLIAGDISARTKETLLKQMGEPLQVKVSEPGPAQMAGDDMDGETRPRARQQAARTQASIDDPVTKIVGLILGSPEFQRQ